MSWQMGAAIAEIISALAVVISLVYLAFQIKQNTRQIDQNTQAVRAAAVDSSIHHAITARQPLIENGEVMRIWLAGADNPLELSREDLFRYRLMLYNGLMSLANVYAQSQYAELASDTWEAQIPAVHRTLATPGGKWFWSNYATDFETEFQREIERIIQGAGA